MLSVFKKAIEWYCETTAAAYEIEGEEKEEPEFAL